MSNRILTTISIIIGACGILYGGINAFVKDPGKLPILGSFLGNPGDITLLLLGLLLVIVGVQNLDLLSDMDEGVERIEDIAKQVLSRLAVNPEPIVLEGEAQIYDCAGKLVRNASRYIRAVAFREIHHMDPPLYWVALTEMLAERLRMRSPVEYRLRIWIWTTRRR